MSSIRRYGRAILLTLLALGLGSAPTLSHAQLASSETAAGAGALAAAYGAVDPKFTVAERGQNFARLQRVTAGTNEAGSAVFSTNSITLLENNIHYLNNGEWRLSEDLLESFPDGAVARRGPDKAIFSNELNTDAVFDIMASDGHRLRGGLRSVQLTDLVSGKSLVLGTVKKSALGKLLPPARLAFIDCLDGLQADLILEWKHNQFSHDLILRQRPELPPELDPASTRLEITTEFLGAAEPVLNEQSHASPGQPELPDDVTISFGQTLMVRGMALGVAGNQALNLSGAVFSEDGVPVVKQWHKSNDGRTFLVESVGWKEIEPYLKDLAVAQSGDLGRRSRQIASARHWPKAPRRAERKPAEVAAAPYAPERGLMVDFSTLTGSQTSYTFTNGVTHYIPGNFYVGSGTATFQPSCVIKFANNAMLMVTGPISFPDTAQTPIFTAYTDDSFGEEVDGTAGSTPTQCASQELLVYYQTSSTVTKNARFRWAKKAVQFTAGSGNYVTHTLQDSLIEQSAVGVYVDLPSASVSLSNVQKCSVTTPVQVYAGTYFGSIGAAPFCTGTSFAGMDSLNVNYVASTLPDSMGAIGPTNFIQLSTHGSITAFHRSSGTNTSSRYLKDFFAASSDLPSDPRVWYDADSQRWVATALDGGVSPPSLLVEVSLTNNPTLNSNDWRRYSVSIPNVNTNAGEGIDFDALGVDTSGIYVSLQVKNSTTNLGYYIQGFKKPDVYTNSNYQSQLPALITVTTNALETWCIQPACNFNSTPDGGYVWFVAKGRTNSSADARVIWSRPAQWNGTNFGWVISSPWQGLSSTNYLSYFDIPQGSTNILAPHSGGSIKLGDTGSRLMMAVIRGSYLYTCQHVGLDGPDANYDGNTVDRSAIQWLKLSVSTNGLSYSTHGRIYDTASSSPYWYYFPSLNVATNGDIVVGFSGSKTGENVGGFFTGYRSGSWLTRPVLVQGGRSAYNDQRGWGDYSATTIDPIDGSFWTIQEYTIIDGASKGWGTWITQIK